MNIKNIIAGLCIVSSSLGVHAQVSSRYSLNEFWSGEYPSPVVKVKTDTKLKATKTIPFGSRPRAARPVACTIQPGVYHPWATKTRATYHSVSGVSVYKAKIDTTVEVDADGTGPQNIAVKKGEKVRQLAYYGEGYCLVEANGVKGGAFCVSEDENYETVVNNSYYQQYLRVTCKEGHQAYISVNDHLFLTKGIEQGKIIDYGSVEE